MRLLITIFIICFISLYGQENGTITGKVTDKKTGEVLPGVNIVLKGTYYGAATDMNGSFRIKNVNPGTYNMEVSFIGYKSIQYTGTKIEPGKTKQFEVKLEESVLTLNQEIVIIGEKPMLDVEETQSKRTISKDDIESAKLDNITDVLTQQSGVIISDNEIHIRGGRSYENAYLLDGVSVQDPLAGTGMGLQLSANAIEDVEVITGGFNAEYGQATSGVVNVRTKEGGSKFHGSVSYKDDNLFGKTSPHVFNTDVLESNLSGPEPITSYLLPELGVQIPGEISFFGNFFGGISDGITQGYSKSVAHQVISSTFGGSRFAPREENNWFWLGKFTYRISPTLKLAYSYNQSVSINQNSQSLQNNLEYVEPSPGYQYTFQNILDNANTFLVSIIGDDEKGRIFAELMQENHLNNEGIFVDETRMTTVKTRIISGGRQISRVDQEISTLIDHEFEKKIFERIKLIIDQLHIHIVIFVDYDKGLISQWLIKNVIELAKSKNILTVADPKRRNFNNYQQVDLFKPNFNEFRDWLKLQIEKTDME